MPPRRHRQSIVLVGPMGVGKTTVGRMLAERLDLSFVDSDAEVESAEGLPVAEIFERRGEAYFRQAERQTVARLAQRPARVIATGGGAFADAATRRLLLERCVTIWLDEEPARLSERIGASQRPLAATAAQLAAARRPFYAESAIRIACGGAPSEAIVERIVAVLAGRDR